MQINEDNYEKAESALKDILFMFVDATVQNGDFSELNLGGFDPFEYLVVKGSSDQTVYMTDGEVDLVMKGAAITLLSKVADIYFDDECHAIDEEDKRKNGVMPSFISRNGNITLPVNYGYLAQIYDVFQTGKFVENQYIESAFKAAFKDETEFYNAMREVLEQVVKPCFSVLSEFKS
ncbi:hypothetical protein ACU6U9_08815 [Pseudomonas sp. HK3]|jgi:hypothetical protein